MSIVTITQHQEQIFIQDYSEQPELNGKVFFFADLNGTEIKHMAYHIPARYAHVAGTIAIQGQGCQIQPDSSCVLTIEKPWLWDGKKNDYITYDLPKNVDCAVKEGASNSEPAATCTLIPSMFYKAGSSYEAVPPMDEKLSAENVAWVDSNYLARQLTVSTTYEPLGTMTNDTGTYFAVWNLDKQGVRDGSKTWLPIETSTAHDEPYALPSAITQAQHDFLVRWSQHSEVEAHFKHFSLEGFDFEASIVGWPEEYLPLKAAVVAGIILIEDCFELVTGYRPAAENDLYPGYHTMSSCLSYIVEDAA
jgi:hypothetical protein